VVSSNNATPVDSAAPAAPLVDHFFRHESGRLVSALSRVFGLRNLDLIEDMVQAALLEALRSWRVSGVPQNPSAWMHRVAKNKVLDALRQQQTARRLLPDWAQSRPDAAGPAIDDALLDTEIADSQLRMIFACCHPRLDREDQIALTLNVLCGFSHGEIARGLLATEGTIKKRLQRAKQKLADGNVSLEVPAAHELADRLNAVHQVLYLLFNEGYSSAAGEAAIRTDVCEEAARLCYLLCCHPLCATPSGLALMALLCFHAARLEARLDEDGRVLLLEDQDRSKWDQRLIARAREFLDKSAFGQRISAYHLEAGIALHHCLAQSFSDTDWPAILTLYDALLRLDRSPIYLLNRAIVIAHIEGPRTGIQALEEIRHDPSLRHYHLLDSTLGELYRRVGETKIAREHFLSARTKTQSPADHELIERRLALCEEERESGVGSRQSGRTE
jgi:RNA polymerase sigma factor (sigma-70 family)